jgi:hypothetical protein
MVNSLVWKHFYAPESSQPFALFGLLQEGSDVKCRYCRPAILTNHDNVLGPQIDDVYLASTLLTGCRCHNKLAASYAEPYLATFHNSSSSYLHVKFQPLLRSSAM